jgi:hypothetical protein
VDLVFGTNVREYGQHVGRLAGFELDPTTRQVRKIIFSSDGELGNHVMTRPFASVLAEPGEIDIRPYTPSDEWHAREAILLGQRTRIFREGRELGRVAGVDVTIGNGELEAVIGRRSWWTRRFRVGRNGLDLSVPGEVRVNARSSQAA